MAEQSEKYAPEKEQNFAEQLCKQANDYLQNIAFPQFKKLQKNFKTFSEEIEAKIKSKKKITQDELYKFRQVGKEVNVGVDKILAGSEQLDKENFMLTNLLMMRTRGLKNQLFGNLYERDDPESYTHQLEAYIETGEKAPRLNLPAMNLDELKFIPENLVPVKDSVSGIGNRSFFAALAREGIRERDDININLSPATIDEEKFSIAHLPDFTTEAFQELIRNAVDAMPSGGTIEYKEKKQGDNLVITISDTGKSISPENLKKIFEKGLTTKAKETGMGLPLVKTYFEDILGGKFEIKSKEGKGTTVTIALPLSKEK
ncbi:ATP-binding protein [Patescibacteria group bacterium AH-259-L05]|nr:ATP-binding protein [Patescibacteria group bacterium AH-259-L05]